MKKSFYLPLIISLLVITSCSKLIDEFYLTPEMKAQIPFQGYETISFLDDSANIIKLTADKRQNYFSTTYECVDCRDYYLSEEVSIKLKNELYIISLGMGVGEDSAFWFNFYHKGNGFGCAFSRIPLSKQTLKYEEVFYDSIIVNNKIYFNIFSDTLKHQGAIQINPYPTYCYYSTEYGVVKIDFSDSTSWELESIEW